MKKVEIYTDGACSGNPGVGGWAAMLIYKKNIKEISGAEKDTTNNRMELLAIISAIEALKEKCNLTIYSDSAYALNPFLENWITDWQAKGWRTQGKSDVKNVDLWQRLLTAMQGHKITWQKVKCHSTNENNNRCDKLARDAIIKLNKSEILNK